MKIYEFKTKRGFLKGIKVTTVEHVREDSWKEQWVDAELIEILLNIDETWRTRREISRNTTCTRTSDEVKAFMEHLLKIGLIERRKVSNKHIEFRRVRKFPKHKGIESR